MLDSLGTLDRRQTFSKQAAKAVQREMLERIAGLSELVYEQKRAAVIVFEGWDASGKGTTIRALTERLDARGYKVLSTQAARTHEKQKPWLWRFWMNIPRHGQIAIYDRSWYGRVLVERVRGLTPLPEWIAAYEEINQFERTLADDGAILLKCWLHISRKEQLRRFILLTQEPATSWQITAEDWENHRLYDEYAAAVRDMLANTNTPYAPWTVIDATSREYRIYSVCRTLIERLEQTLGVPPSTWPNWEELARVAPAEKKDRPEKKEKLEKQEKTKKKEEKKEEKKEKKAKELAAAAEHNGTPPENGQLNEGGKKKKKDKNLKKDQQEERGEAVDGEGAVANAEGAAYA